MSYIHFTTAPHQLVPVCSTSLCFPNITTEDNTYWYGGKLQPDLAKSFRPLLNLVGFDLLMVQM